MKFVWIEKGGKNKNKNKKNHFQFPSSEEAKGKL